MLLKKTLAFMPRHADENCCFVDVDGKTQLPELRHEPGDLVKCFNELGPRAENTAPEKVVREDLQIR